MPYQLTIRDTQTDGREAIRTLCATFVQQRSANKAIWMAIRRYPDLVAERNSLRMSVHRLRRELDELRAAVLAAEDARQTMLHLAGPPDGLLPIGPGGSSRLDGQPDPETPRAA